MPSLPPTSAIILVTVALIFSFLNGAKDGANALATIITSRALGLGWALGIVGLAEFAGPFVVGIAVARTIGANVVKPESITILVVTTGLVGATPWNVVTWRLGIPTSSSHALVGGLIGAVLMSSRFDTTLLQPSGLLKIALGLFLAPILAMVAAFVVSSTAQFLLRNATPRANWFFKRGQLLTTVGLALSHGANDAPKTMGIITLGLVSAGILPAFDVPLWVMIAAALTVSAGTVLGSQRLIRTIGTRFYRVRPFDALNSQFASALLVVGASLLGSPVSTSQVVSSAIVGAGAAQRLTRVRWGILGEIIVGWLLTIPATAIVGAVNYWLASQWVGP